MICMTKEVDSSVVPHKGVKIKQTKIKLQWYQKKKHDHNVTTRSAVTCTAYANSQRTRTGRQWCWRYLLPCLRKRCSVISTNPSYKWRLLNGQKCQTIMPYNLNSKLQCTMYVTMPFSLPTGVTSLFTSWAHQIPRHMTISRPKFWTQSKILVYVSPLVILTTFSAFFLFKSLLG